MFALIAKNVPLWGSKRPDQITQLDTRDKTVPQTGEMCLNMSWNILTFLEQMNVLSAPSDSSVHSCLRLGDKRPNQQLHEDASGDPSPPQQVQNREQSGWFHALPRPRQRRWVLGHPVHNLDILAEDLTWHWLLCCCCCCVPERVKLKRSDYPLVLRVMQGPCEQVCKVFLMEADLGEEVTYDVSVPPAFQLSSPLLVFPKVGGGVPLRGKEQGVAGQVPVLTSLWVLMPYVGLIKQDFVNKFMAT